MTQCAYCQKQATTECALGLPACANHRSAADEYYAERTGRSPNADNFLFCPEHGDLWESGCARCEQCCQHHYSCSVREKFGDAKTPEGRGLQIIPLDT